MDVIMDIKGYLFLICKDIFFHSRYSRVYPFISFISSNLFIDIQLFIHLYPFLIPFYPDISTSYPAFLSFYILTFIPFILLVIRSGSRLIRLVRACCLIRTSFACPAQQQSKPLCFYFPAPRCGHHRLPLLAAPAPGP
jgi:hypothetical protein